MIIQYARKGFPLRAAVLICIAVCNTTNSARERIATWESDIAVRDNGTMHVVERLIVVSEGMQIRHGIRRDLPTRYKNIWGLRYNVGFHINKILLDGRAAAYRVQDYANGVRIYIGDSNTTINKGLHEYVLDYDTSRQIGFFENYDELYWNVTGLDWPFVIERTRARVALPARSLDGMQVNGQQLHVSAYTGGYGQKGQNFKAVVRDNEVQFDTTEVLWPHQGLTVAVNWPKGIVAHQPMFWPYIKDNLHIVLLGILLCLLLIFYGYVYYSTRRQIKRGAIIPLFYPPQDERPGVVRYIDRMSYDSTCLTATIVDMAVHGLLTIEHSQGSFFAKSYYTLKKNPDVQIEQEGPYSSIMKKLFSKSDTCVLKSEQAHVINSADSWLSQTYALKYGIDLFDAHSQYVTAGFTASLLGVLVAAFSVPEAYNDFLFWALVVLHAVSHIVVYCIMPTYTQPGQQLKEQIGGFKMFLKTTEAERLKLIGTPPTKNPELYERYLPYAIALGVEQQWSQQFALVFKELQAAGHPYEPSWFYAGHPFMAADLLFLSRGFGSSLNSAIREVQKPITSSTYSPGSRSGSGGGGYSGGGGGGGGGGGW